MRLNPELFHIKPIASRCEKVGHVYNSLFTAFGWFCNNRLCLHSLEGAVEKAAAVKPEIRFFSNVSSIKRLATLPVPLDVKTLKKCIAFEKLSWVLLTTTGSQIHCFRSLH